MPRAVWSGAISFGLVSIPVKLFTAVSSKTVRFNQIDRRSGSRVRQRLVSETDGAEVPRSDIAKGYQLGPGEYVLVDDSELEALDPKAEHTIDIEEFVDLADIDPIYFDRPYWLAPDPGTAKPYALLARTMAESNKVAIARFVMRSRQQLAAVRAVDGRLVMSTMNWADELVDPAELPGFDALDDFEVSEREQKLAEQLIESLAADWDPTKYHDTHREQVLALIDRKASGDEEVVTTGETAGTGGEVVDLMAALEASVEGRRRAKGRHPSSTAEGSETAKGTRSATAKSPAKKAPAKKQTAKKAPAKKQTAKKAPAKKQTGATAKRKTSPPARKSA
ncbi:MAG: Ku protein [Acidimicrobiales bacterium]|nr:Ku protein [Acidimicrobiales bacterium]